MTKAKEKEETTAVAVKASTSLPAHLNLDAVEADRGAGAQNIKASDTQTPLLTVLQSNSPQCKKMDGKYIKGAEEGHFFNNVTNEVYDGAAGIIVVPCFFEKVYIEWKPNRGGFVEIHGVDTPLKDQVKMVPSSENPDKLIPILPNGNILIETNQHYVLLLKEDGSFEPAVMPMSSSALKTSRQWNTLIKRVMLQGKSGMFNPASYYCHYKITTVARQNDDFSWAGMSVENLGPVPTNEIYSAGRALEQAVNAGTVKVKQELNDEPGVTAGQASATAKDDEIPF